MHRIYKQQLQTIGIQDIKVPSDARIRCVQNQNDRITIWYEVFTDKEGMPMCKEEIRTIGIYGTGHPIKCLQGNRTYLGTVQIQGFVWHVFHLVEKGTT